MRLSAFALSAFAWSCAHVASRDGDPLRIDGLDAIASKQMILLGDMHGTREIPRFTAALAHALAQRKPVVLGLEMPAHATFDAFLASDGGPAAQAALLTGPFWQDPFQDGRRSVAALELLVRVRQLRADGIPLEVFFFDAAGDEKVSRDQAMATNILARHALRPDATFLLMMGNLHARKVPGSPWKPADHYAWLASLLPAATSLTVRHPLGTAWVCFGPDASGCGPQVIGGDDTTTQARVTLRGSADGAFDGTFEVGSLTASPPAAFPEHAAGLDERLAALLTSPRATIARATSDYKRGDFTSCAHRLDALPSPTPDDLYTQACCLARSGQKKRALDTLRSAITAGFDDLESMQHDDDLASLHSLPGWPTKTDASH